MKQLIVSAFATAAFLAAAILLQPHAPSLGQAASSESISAGKLRDVDANLLPVEQFEDMSLVFWTRKQPPR